MRRTMIGAVAGLLVLAGCTGTTEPAQPPTQEDALTTATVAPVATSDEVEVTTDAPVTGDETEETAEPEAAIPPEMPDEAKEQTQEGAMAFAEHFVDVVNYTGVEPTGGLIADLSTNECETCSNLEETVVYSEENREVLPEDAWTVGKPPEVLVFDGSQAVVRLTVDEAELPVLDTSGAEVDRTVGGTFQMALDLRWNDDGWVVNGVQMG